MSELVEEILTLSQITADELSTRPAPVRISSAVAEAVADVATPEAGTVTVRGGDDCCVLVDPRHLHRILTNLVSNALKYGAPPVEISAVDAGDAVEISVRDHGEGVPAEFQPRLFGRFTRADTPATRAKKGTGLGLYIVRKLAEANDGAVTYRNHPAGGGCFTLRLPGGRQPADTA
jgi:signal transduction histidine kinase